MLFRVSALWRDMIDIRCICNRCVHIVWQSRCRGRVPASFIWRWIMSRVQRRSQRQHVCLWWRWHQCKSCTAYLVLWFTTLFTEKCPENSGLFACLKSVHYHPFRDLNPRGISFINTSICKSKFKKYDFPTLLLSKGRSEWILGSYCWVPHFELPFLGAKTRFLFLHLHIDSLLSVIAIVVLTEVYFLVTITMWTNNFYQKTNKTFCTVTPGSKMNNDNRS